MNVAIFVNDNNKSPAKADVLLLKIHNVSNGHVKK